MKAKKSTSGKAPVKAVGRAAPGLPKKRPAAADIAAGTAEAGQATKGIAPAAVPERPAKKARKKPPAGSAADLASGLHIKSEGEASGLQSSAEDSAAPKGKKRVRPANPRALCMCLQTQCCHVLTSKACASWTCGAYHCIGAPVSLSWPEHGAVCLIY